jgi:exonuclease VII small subunit
VEDRYETEARREARSLLRCAYANLDQIIRRVESKGLTLAPDCVEALEEARARVQRVALRLG